MGLATRITNEYRMPDLRNNTITMPGRHGVFDFGETVSERKILISCFIPPGKTDEQFLSKKDDIIEWLNPDNGLRQLILDKEPGRVYEARLTSGFSFDRAVRNSCTFDLEFFCPDPYGYAISDETFDFAETGTFTASRTLGNIESYPVYSLTGVIPSGTDSYISITTNSSELQIIGRLAAGETLIIDSDLMTAKVVDSKGLRAECFKLHGCKTGNAKITRGYNLPCKYVIHTVGPIWHGGGKGEPEMLSACYRNSLHLAQENGIRRIAFPSISTGVFHYPVDRAAETAIIAVRKYLEENPGSFDLIEWVLFDDLTYAAYDNTVKNKGIPLTE